MSVTQANVYTDVVELCALLQCLGFNIKSLETTDGSVSQDGGRTRSVTINCQASGFHVVMESANTSCSCPTPSHQNSGMWEVSGVTGGKHLSKECGSALLGSLPKAHRERLTLQLQDIVRCIKDYNDTESEKHKEGLGNKSASMIELKTPDKRHQNIKAETPTRYRSLDTLTTGGHPPTLPVPGALLKATTTEDSADEKKFMCQRQSTYTLSSTPESSRRRNKTSSPIKVTSNSVLESLIDAEKKAEELRNKICSVIKELSEDGKHDSSISSLALDVSKISVLKGAESSKIQFSSSPNLSGLGVQDDFMKRLKRADSASTSNLVSKPSTKESKPSKLSRISPNLFKNKPTNKADKGKTAHDTKSSKLNNLFKPRLVTPVRATKTPEPSPNLSASRKKFINVKSTIPRPASKKE